MFIFGVFKIRLFQHGDTSRRGGKKNSDAAHPSLKSYRHTRNDFASAIAVVNTRKFCMSVQRCTGCRMQALILGIDSEKEKKRSQGSMPTMDAANHCHASRRICALFIRLGCHANLQRCLCVKHARLCTIHTIYTSRHFVPHTMKADFINTDRMKWHKFPP